MPLATSKKPPNLRTSLQDIIFWELNGGSFSTRIFLKQPAKNLQIYVCTSLLHSKRECAFTFSHPRFHEISTTVVATVDFVLSL